MGGVVGAAWVNPEKGEVWVYRHPSKGILGVVWKDIGEYAATGPLEPGEDYRHAELGEYHTLAEAQGVVENVASGDLVVSTSRRRYFGPTKGEW